MTLQERHDAKTVQQLKIFVQKLPHMQQEKISLSKRELFCFLIKLLCAIVGMTYSAVYD